MIKDLRETKEILVPMEKPDQREIPDLKERLDLKVIPDLKEIME